MLFAGVVNASVTSLEYMLKCLKPKYLRLQTAYTVWTQLPRNPVKKIPFSVSPFPFHWDLEIRSRSLNLASKCEAHWKLIMQSVKDLSTQKQQQLTLTKPWDELHLSLKSQESEERGGAVTVHEHIHPHNNQIRFTKDYKLVLTLRCQCNDDI